MSRVALPPDGALMHLRAGPRPFGDAAIFRPHRAAAAVLGYGFLEPVPDPLEVLRFSGRTGPQRQFWDRFLATGQRMPPPSWPETSLALHAQFYANTIPASPFLLTAVVVFWLQASTLGRIASFSMSDRFPTPHRRGAVAVIIRQGRFLVIRRSRQVVAPRAYCFPGGGIENDETEVQALAREIEEELGVAVCAQRRLWESVTPWGVELAWWLGELADEASLAPNPAEVESVHWCTPQEMAQLHGLLESNQHFLRARRRRDRPGPLIRPPPLAGRQARYAGRGAPSDRPFRLGQTYSGKPPSAGRLARAGNSVSGESDEEGSSGRSCSTAPRGEGANRRLNRSGSKGSV